MIALSSTTTLIPLLLLVLLLGADGGKGLEFISDKMKNFSVAAKKLLGGRFLISWLAVLLWLAVIAHFSAQPQARQDIRPFLERQEWLLRAVAALPEMEIRYPGRAFNSRREPVLFVQLVFRKVVHVVLYGTGGLLFLGAFNASGLKGARAWAAAVVLVAAAGAFDECRQAGAEGRSGLPQDVALDLAGFLLFYAIVGVLKRKKAR